MKHPSFHFKKGFGSDNHSGIHPRILQFIQELNSGHAHSYGMDEVSELCVKEFQNQFGNDWDVHFVFNGTAANVLALMALLKPYETVICSDQAHIYRDECSAPERHLGCKVVPIASENGKIKPESMESYVRTRRGDQHWAQPRVVSLTQPTEVGTVYSLNELKDIVDWAHDQGLLVHMDGARLANAAVYLKCNFKELTQGIDAVSLGGTKNGLWGAEAVLLNGHHRRKDFKYLRKQTLQLPSKMRFLSGQFLAYFQEGLWEEIATHSLKMAQYMKNSINSIDEIKLTYPVQSNALFPTLPQTWVKPLREHSFFYVWDETQWMMRWMTSFDTQITDIDSFVRKIKELSTRTT